LEICPHYLDGAAFGGLDSTRLYYKEGGGGGFHCMMRLYPSSGIGTVVMTNATGFDVRKLLDRTDCAFLERGSIHRDET